MSERILYSRSFFCILALVFLPGGLMTGGTFNLLLGVLGLLLGVVPIALYLELALKYGFSEEDFSRETVGYEPPKTVPRVLSILGLVIAAGALTEGIAWKAGLLLSEPSWRVVFVAGYIVTVLTFFYLEEQ
jgi:hypothetical protein